jgi:diguanylate cyclase (GGDEF)-like protein/PAS domain S-box-containing protein
MTGMTIHERASAIAADLRATRTSPTKIEDTPLLDDGGIEDIFTGGPSVRYARLLDTVVAQAGVGVGISDITGRILAVNTVFAAMFGYDSAEEFVDMFKVTDLTHPDDPPGVWERYADLIRGDVEQVHLEKPHRHRDGHTVWNSINVSLIRASDGTPAYTLALFADVTDRHQLEERMHHLALHDPLTGLPNRTQFFDHLNEAFRDLDSRVGVCYVGLDGFKAINDTLGHDVGDNLLVEVANQLRSCIQRPGHLVARMGGDEFIVLVPQTNGPEEVSQLADSVLRALAAPIQVDGHSLTLSASIGVMEEQVANTSTVELMKAADASLVWAKEAGRSRWAMYDPDRESTRYYLSSAMRAALENGEFILEYQPIIRLADNVVIGAEALVRWKHPTLGILAPGRFIDLAEDNGFIVPLTAHVIEEACRQASSWCNDNAAHQPYVSVNVSATNIRDPGLIPLIERVLADTGLPPHALQLELTENASLSTSETVVTTLQKLTALGLSIAIDDFGTGFSSLAYLRKLPIHVVKLAGEFIENLDRRMHCRLADEQITRAMIELAHTLGLTVTAEQVETSSQADRLRAMHCDAAQGWHFAKSLPPDTIRAALRNPCNRCASANPGPSLCSPEP